jgi:hypothetical protein
MRLALLRFAPVRSASANLARMRSAPLRSASASLAPLRPALQRVAPLRFALIRIASPRRTLFPCIEQVLDMTREFTRGIDVVLISEWL